MEANPIPVLAAGQTRKRNVFDILQTLEEQKENGLAKKVLVRVDFNVPMSPEGDITDDSRIRGALPTICAILGAQCNVVLISHMGRPDLVQKGKENDETKEQRASLSLRPIADRLAA